MINEVEVRHIAKLARLKISDDEALAYTEHLGRILQHFDELSTIDTAGIPMTTHPLPVANAMRSDTVTPGLTIDSLLSNAPQPEGNFFRVPRILES